MLRGMESIEAIYLSAWGDADSNGWRMAIAKPRGDDVPSRQPPVRARSRVAAEDARS